jgi:hypothetical protein
VVIISSPNHMWFYTIHSFLVVIHFDAISFVVVNIFTRMHYKPPLWTKQSIQLFIHVCSNRLLHNHG